MGILVDWGRSVIEEAKKEVMEDKAGKLSSVCQEVTKEIREDIVHSWFGGFNYGSMDSATHNEPHIANFSSDSITVVVDSYVESGDYHPASMTLDKWNARHHMGGDAPTQILQMQMYEPAFIGLPQASTVSNWKNRHFHPKSPGLEAELFSNGKWSAFESKVKAKL